jgi:hypothetical protein
MGRGVGRLVLVAAVVLGVASCGSQTGSVSVVTGGSDSGSVGSPAVTAAGRSYPGTICRGVNDGLSDPTRPDTRPRLATDFAAVTAVTCTVETEQVAGNGQWNVMVEKRATAGLDRLLTTIRQPDSALTTSSCAAYAQIDPEVWFIDAAGQAVLPSWPRDSCDHIPTEATAALTALAWTTTARVKMVQMVPQAAIDAGCSTAFKYLVQLIAGQAGTAKPGSFADLAHSADPHLCRYRHTGDDPVSGDFESGHPLSATAWTSLRQALEATTPAQPCTRAATRFALISAGPFVEIELDGCHRVLTPDNGLRQATPSLLALLT